MNNIESVFNLHAEFDCKICHPNSTADIIGVCDEHMKQHLAEEAERQKNNKEVDRQRDIIQTVRRGFPYEFHMCDIKNIEQKYQAKITDWLHDPLNWCLFLQGTVGSGKSYMAYSTVKQWLSEGQTTLFHAFSSMDLVHYMQKDYNGQGSDHYNELKKTHLLLIDDLGTERSTEDSLFQVMRLIYSRHTEMKKTIITTNLSIDDLASKFHPRLTSRIMGGTPIVLKGKDRRLENQAAKAQGKI